MELKCKEDGYLIAILKGDGETVPVTEVISYLGEEGKPPNRWSSTRIESAPAAASLQAVTIRAMMLVEIDWLRICY